MMDMNKKITVFMFNGEPIGACTAGNEMGKRVSSTCC